MYDKPFHTGDLASYQFLITGGAGFIGSNIVEYLLKYGAGRVVVLDNLATGFERNVKLFEGKTGFEFIHGDIRDFEVCKKACEGIDFVLHQAALGSVPRSIHDPITTNQVNIDGFLNMLTAARDAKVNRFVYAASSSTYGDSPNLPKVEDKIGKPLSPYAVTKYVNELYADVFHRVYGLNTIGLRYFNVFGPRQDPHGAYAAVIPLFIHALREDRSPFINGDGKQTRDFTFVENAVEANIRAAFSAHPEALNQVYNVAVGDRTGLLEMYEILRNIAEKDIPPAFREPRAGDIRDSLADISKAEKLLGYQPAIRIKEGLEITFKWFETHNI